MLNRRRTLDVLLIFCCISGALAQDDSINLDQKETITVPRAQPKNLMKVEVLQQATRKFHDDLSSAEEQSGQEHFSEAIALFDAVIQETEDFIKRIAAAGMPKGSIDVDGTQQPITIQNETGLFQRVIDRAQHGKTQALALTGITATQKQAADLLAAGQYLEARDVCQKEQEALAAIRTQVDDATLKLFEARAEATREASVTLYWSKKFAALRNRYNQAADNSDKLSPGDVRSAIQSVSDEITGEAYTDPAKYPDMPADTRDLFRQILDSATQFLKAQ